MFTSLFSLFYVTGEFHRFLHRGKAIDRRTEAVILPKQVDCFFGDAENSCCCLETYLNLAHVVYNRRQIGKRT